MNIFKVHSKHLQDLLAAKSTRLPYTSEEDEKYNFNDFSFEKTKRKKIKKSERKLHENKSKSIKKNEIEEANNLKTTSCSYTLSESINSKTEDDVTTIKNKSKTREVEVQTDIILTDLLPWNFPTSVVYSENSRITCPSTSDYNDPFNYNTQQCQKKSVLSEQSKSSCEYLESSQSQYSIQKSSKCFAIFRLISYALKCKFLRWSVCSLLLSDSIINITFETNQLLKLIKTILEK